MKGILGFCHRPSDCEVLLSHLNHYEDELQLKRRWLAGLSLSKSLADDRCLPESIIRTDDVFYELLKGRISDAFGVELNVTLQMGKVNESTTLRILSSSSALESLTNECLCQISTLLSGSSKFTRTRKKMKALIKSSLTRISVDNSSKGVALLRDLSLIVSNSRYVRGDTLSSTVPSCSPLATATRIVSRLEELPIEVLLSMYRKLRGIPAGTPHLQQNRNGWSRDVLIRKIRKYCEKLMAEVNVFGDLPAPLAHALYIASYSFSTSLGSSFGTFSPATRALQEEIAKSILLVKTKVRMPDLITLKHLLDPDSNVSNSCLRTSIRKLLTMYLFECSELENIPKELAEALAVISKEYQCLPYCLLRETDVEKDVNSVLNISAQMKQITWNFIDDYDMERDFCDAQMEELEDSEESDDDFAYNNADSLDAASEDNHMVNSQSCREVEERATLRTGISASPETNSSIRSNLYISVEEACDDSSILAYDLIGRIMCNIAKGDGLVLDERHYIYLNSGKISQEEKYFEQDTIESIVVKSANELLPALPSGEMDRLKSILGI